MADELKEVFQKFSGNKSILKTHYRVCDVEGTSLQLVFPYNERHNDIDSSSLLGIKKKLSTTVCWLDEKTLNNINKTL